MKHARGGRRIAMAASAARAGALGALIAAQLALISAAFAAGPIDAWRDEAAVVRTLAENDAPHAYEEAKRLEATLPAEASAADRARALNLLARTETYLA